MSGVESFIFDKTTQPTLKLGVRYNDWTEEFIWHQLNNDINNILFEQNRAHRKDKKYTNVDYQWNNK